MTKWTVTNAFLFDVETFGWNNVFIHTYESIAKSISLGLTDAAQRMIKKMITLSRVGK